jgi:hypothetical protein
VFVTIVLGALVAHRAVVDAAAEPEAAADDELVPVPEPAR